MSTEAGQQGGVCEMTDEEKRERLLRTYRALCEENFKGVPEISSEELLQILTHPCADVRASVVLVDCRSEAEQSVSCVQLVPTSRVVCFSLILSHYLSLVCCYSMR